jgi:hypothetical protein
VLRSAACALATAFSRLARSSRRLLLATLGVALKNTNQLRKVIAGIRLNDGIEVIQVPANYAA